MSITTHLGMKVHWSDANHVVELEPSCYEIHLSEKDLEKHYSKMVDIFSSEPFSKKVLLVHAPLTFSENDIKLVVDISSNNLNIRRKSIQIIRNTLSFVSDISAKYLVVHPGGISSTALEKVKLSANLISSLKELRSKRILLENMPWFYWFGKKRERSNILIFSEEFEDILPFCGGICLDFCHAYLSQPRGSLDTIIKFFNIYPEEIKHLHISDAKSPDGEGLQIGEGEINFISLFNAIYKIVKEETGGRSFTLIPEIKDGHLNKSEKTKVAYKKLKALLKEAKWNPH